VEYEDRPGLGSVAPDNYRAGRLLVEMLAALGHRHLAYLCGPTFNSDARLKGCLDAQRDLGLPGIQIHPAIDNQMGIEAGYRTCRQLLETHVDHFPSAVIGYNDLYALGAMKRLKEAGMRVPEEVSVAGFGDHEFSQYANPSLTTVGLATHQLGRLGVQKLLHLMGVGPEPGQNSAPLEVQIRTRESTARAHSD
jgi:DNA-binding LacI/PurR family transcriptional regulator